MPRALFVSYTFPPVGGAGVQRLTKWLKYLPENGWESSVLTVDNASVPVTDASLAGDIPPATRVVRARTLEPSYAVKDVVSHAEAKPLARWRSLARTVGGAVLQPDPQVLWAPAAVTAGRRLLRDAPHDVVVATGPPYSTFGVAAWLARRARLPLVLDFRDEWDLSSRYQENRPRDRLSVAVQSRMQARLLRAADLVIATTRRSAAALEARCRAAGGRAPAVCIYNGYDEEDFRPAPRSSGRPGLHLAYVGTLWALTDVAPLVAGLDRLAERDPALARDTVLTIAGRRTAAQSAVLQAARSRPYRIETTDYLPHNQAVDLMRSAGALCLLLSGVPGADRVMPAKVFEYLAARRPILAIAPEGEVRDLLNGRPWAFACDPSDPDGVADAITRIAQQNGAPAADAAHDASAFSRRRLAGELSDALASLLRGRAAR